MLPEDVQNEIKLIFARACAESLKETANIILRMEGPDKEERAKAHGAAFASAFVFVSGYFNTECLSMSPSSAAHTDQSSSTHEAEPQQLSALPGQP